MRIVETLSFEGRFGEVGGWSSCEYELQQIWHAMRISLGLLHINLGNLTQHGAV